MYKDGTKNLPPNVMYISYSERQENNNIMKIN